MRFQNKVVLITGGAAGIGKACAAKFAAEGAVVLICDVNEEVGQATAQEIGASFYKVNVADRQDVQRWVDAVVAAHGRIDVLINNAGILRDGQLVKMKDGKVVKQMSEADWDLLIDINLKGVFNCTQAVAPVMINQGGGVILNASSIVGLDGNFGQTNYVAAKAGVIGMTKVWARELGRYGIRVNAIAPGFTLTDMVRQMPAEILQNMAARVPLGRLGEVADIANAYAFLASADASYISGVTLRVDGGIVVGT